jgi:hypothetical protein
LQDDVAVTLLALFLGAGVLCVSLTQHGEWSKVKRWLIGVGVICLFSVVGVRAWSNAEKKELAKNAGPFLPAYEQTPVNTCPIPPDRFILFLGSGTISSTSGFPHTIVQFGGHPVLALAKDKNGNLLLNFQIFDDRGDIIARMAQSDDGINSFWVNPGSRMVRNDRSSLIVFDHKDQPVLEVHYLKFAAVKIKGVFRDPDNPSKKVVISEDEVRTAFFEATHSLGKSNCLSENDTDYAFCIFANAVILSHFPLSPFSPLFKILPHRACICVL